jgi:tetratricopeptide (TPR) repeat protein
MPSGRKSLTEETYASLLSLYKNPTGPPGRAAASDRDKELAARRSRLLGLFLEEEKKGSWAEKPALYFKILALLYEVDDYCGLTPFVESIILNEPSSRIGHFEAELKCYDSADQRAARAAGITNLESRSLWKAKVLCCVAAIEARRKVSHSKDLLTELNALEGFVKKRLHRPPARPAWTTLAFVRAAQARVARQGDFSYVRGRLLSVIECLDERAEEIIKQLDGPPESGQSATKRELMDDLVLIRQKHTLAVLFNVGLANLQRGFLRTANFACQAARFEFRLTGHSFHRLFNDLLLISIKRGRLPRREKKKELEALIGQLEKIIREKLNPESGVSNPKLYLYALRDLAAIQIDCGEFEEAQKTLVKMKDIRSLGRQWASRINVLNARALYRQWDNTPKELRDEGPLRTALSRSEEAFDSATGLKGGIRKYKEAGKLLAAIRGSESENLIDTVESLVTYGTVQLFLSNPDAAMISAGAVIELCKDDNPRLLAMGHLVAAEAHLQDEFILAAREHLASARKLESRIDHVYVRERRVAVERSMSRTLEFGACESFKEAEKQLLGWYILRYSSVKSVNKVASEIGVHPRTLKKYLKNLEDTSPYSDLKKLLRRKHSEE